MKKDISIMAISVATLFYLAGAFYNASFYLPAWDETSRAVVAIAGVVFILIGVQSIWLFKSDTKG